jgi:hypothetical protein
VYERQLMIYATSYMKYKNYEKRIQPAEWRNGSASDSRSEGCVFKSRLGHFFLLFSSFSSLGNPFNLYGIIRRFQRVDPNGKKYD